MIVGATRTCAFLSKRNSMLLTVEYSSLLFKAQATERNYQRGEKSNKSSINVVARNLSFNEHSAKARKCVKNVTVKKKLS